jgi:hypothetical protein
MNNNKFIGFIATAALVASLIAVFLVLRPQTTGPKAGAADFNSFFHIPTNTSATCGTGSTLAVASSTARQYTAIVNDSANTIYISLGAAAVSGTGIRLDAAGGSYEIKPDNLWLGAIYCIASGSSNLTVITN